MNKYVNCKLKRKLALILAFSILTQISGISALRGSVLNGSPAVKESSAQDGAVIILRNDRTVLVNGQKAVTGSAIASGAQIETLAGAEAEVQISPSGRVKIFPKTKAVVSFVAGSSIDVRVERGCVSLFVKKNYSGVLTLPDGKTKASKAGEDSELNNCDDDELAAVIGAATVGAGGVGLGALSLPVLISILAGAVTVAAVGIAVGDEPVTASPMRP